jgi:hypothetical protein
MDADAAKKLLDTKLAEHGLAAQGWTGHLDSAVRRFGVCDHRRKRITLSRHLAAINSDAETLDTVLHEIAHALAGPQAGHDLQWRAVAAKIGANPDGIHDAEEAASVAGSWFLVHAETGEVFRSYHRRPARTDLSGTWIRGRRAETQGKLKVISARERALQQQGGEGDGAIRSFDRATVQALGEEITAAITEVCAHHGLEVQPEGGKFDPGTYRCSYAIRVPGEQVEDGDRAEFGLHAHLFGLTKDDFGRGFRSPQGERFTLVALKPRNRKYPVIGKDSTGRRYKFSAGVLATLA